MIRLYLLLKPLVGITFICFLSVCNADSAKAPQNLISVIITDTGETETLELRGRQSAQVMVYLSSLGDMLDTYMVSLVDTSRQKLVSNLITDTSGAIVFKKLPPGKYAVYVNRKVATEEQEKSTVKISDVVIKPYP